MARAQQHSPYEAKDKQVNKYIQKVKGKMEADNLAFTAPRWIKPVFKETLQHSQLMLCILDLRRERERERERALNTSIGRYSDRATPRLFDVK